MAFLAPLVAPLLEGGLAESAGLATRFLAPRVLPALASVGAGRLVDHETHHHSSGMEDITNAIMGALMPGIGAGAVGKIPFAGGLLSKLVRPAEAGMATYLGRHYNATHHQEQQQPAQPSMGGGLMSMLGLGSQPTQVSGSGMDLTRIPNDFYHRSIETLGAPPAPNYPSLLDRMNDPTVAKVVDSQIHAANIPHKQAVAQRKNDLAVEHAVIKSLHDEYHLQTQGLQHQDAANSQKLMDELTAGGHDAQSALDDSFAKISASMAGDSTQAGALAKQQMDQHAQQEQQVTQDQAYAKQMMDASDDPLSALQGAADLQAQNDNRSAQTSAQKDINAERALMEQNQAQRPSMLSQLAQSMVQDDSDRYKQMEGAWGDQANLFTAAQQMGPSYLQSMAALSGGAGGLKPSTFADLLSSPSGRSVSYTDAKGRQITDSQRFGQRLLDNPNALTAAASQLNIAPGLLQTLLAP